MYQQQQMHQTQYHHHQQLYGYQVFKRRSKQNVESVDALPMMPRKPLLPCPRMSLFPRYALPLVLLVNYSPWLDDKHEFLSCHANLK